LIQILLRIQSLFRSNAFVSRDFIENLNLFCPDSSPFESIAFIFQSNHRKFEITSIIDTCKIFNPIVSR